MTRASWAVAILVQVVAACGTPSAQPTASPASTPIVSNPPAASADQAAGFCAALEEHATAAAALAGLDPSTATVDQLKAAALDTRTTLAALTVAFATSGLQAQLGNQFQQVAGGTSGVLDAIERLPAEAPPAEVGAALEAFGWPEPLSSDQETLFSDLREAACT